MAATLAPWEDSPNKGSRDVQWQDAMEWGTQNLGSYLRQNSGDPYGLFDATKVSDYLGRVSQGNQAWQDFTGAEGGDTDFTSPYYKELGAAYGLQLPSQEFTDFTIPQLQSFLDRQREDVVRAGNIGGDDIWMPKLVDNNGMPMVSFGKPNAASGGLLDKLSEFVGPALMSGVGALSGGFGLGDLLKGLGIDAPWGVNPQTGSNVTGGSMDFSDFITNSYSPGDFTGSMLPGGSNSIFGQLGGGMVDLGSGAASVAGAGWSPNFLETITNGIQSLGSEAAKAAAKSTLGKLLSGQGTQQDWASLLGTLGSTGLGVLGSNQQSDALTQIANQSRSDRAPFLNAATGWLNNPSSYYSSEPAQAAMKGVLHGLSVNGNPANNPTALASATEAGLRNWQNAVTGFGNIGLSGQDSRNSLLSNAAAADSNVYNALGYGLNNLTQPKQSLSDLMKAFSLTGLA